MKVDELRKLADKEVRAAFNHADRVDTLVGKSDSLALLRERTRVSDTCARWTDTLSRNGLTE